MFNPEESVLQNAIIDAKAFSVSDLSSGIVHLFNLAGGCRRCFVFYFIIFANTE